ncbi:MAG: hypothetical protein R3D29_03190 [Nitratireductor sp.]
MWHADTRFKDAYLAEFPGYYKTADAGFIDEEGYLYIMAHRRHHQRRPPPVHWRWKRIAEHKDVAECAVIGIAEQARITIATWISDPQFPVSIVILSKSRRKARGPVRDKIGPVAAFKLAIAVKRLLKTRSGKILRGTMQKSPMARTGKCLPPSTIRRSSTRLAKPQGKRHFD